MQLTGSDFEQVTNHHQINGAGIHKNLLFFRNFSYKKWFSEINPSVRQYRIYYLHYMGNQIFIPLRQCRPYIFAFAQNQQILPQY